MSGLPRSSNKIDPNSYEIPRFSRESILPRCADEDKENNDNENGDNGIIQIIITIRGGGSNN